MTFDEGLSMARHVVTYIMGIATTLGVMKLTNTDLTVVSTSIDHIFNGLKEISVGAGPLIAMAMAWWAKRRLSPPEQLKAVASMPEVEKVVVAPTVPPNSPAAVLAADTTVPKITKGA
jgi:hypothetical protein